jgi:uncharacterized protein (TIGR02186 family)
MTRLISRPLYGAVLMALVAALTLLALLPADAQRRQRSQPVPTIQAPPFQQKSFPPPLPTLPEVMPPESVQADVSTRSVAITSSFTGTEIIVFGAVDNSRQTSAESGIYDVVVVLEGVPTRIVSRKKSRVAGIWLNTSYVTYESVPSYYAIASTRPAEEVADETTLRENQVGFDHLQMIPAETSHPMSEAEIKEFRESVIRLKNKDGLFVQEDYGVVFIGRSLFRASIDLPANVPVGPLVARIYLLREGQLLSRYIARVNLEREGVERLLHTFAIQHSWWYGLATVLLAAASGLVASRLFRRSAH